MVHASHEFDEKFLKKHGRSPAQIASQRRHGEWTAAIVASAEEVAADPAPARGEHRHREERVSRARHRILRESRHYDHRRKCSFTGGDRPVDDMQDEPVEGSDNAGDDKTKGDSAHHHEIHEIPEDEGGGFYASVHTHPDGSKEAEDHPTYEDAKGWQDEKFGKGGDEGEDSGDGGDGMSADDIADQLRPRRRLRLASEFNFHFRFSLPRLSLPHQENRPP